MASHPALRYISLLHSSLTGRGSLSQKLAVMRDFREYLRACAGDDRGFPITRCKAYPRERGQVSGAMRGHYFHQDVHVARRVFEHNPERHIDVGSRIDGFVAHVASFRQIEVLDIRPQTDRCHDISFRQADLLALGDELLGASDSVSCLHTIEHIGLGRYGDPIDPGGHVSAVRALGAMVRSGGRLYVSTPIGPQRVEFHAHRVFGVPFLLEMLEREAGCDVRGFAYVDDAGDFHGDIDWTSKEAGDNFGCRYGCGIVELVKRDG
ncbi:MAG: DUF268 domain-containing protein [Phycisphaerales bacterium JB043]